MKIVHLSDLHGNHMEIPRADLYVVTGDMLPNFPWLRVRKKNGEEVEYNPYDRNLLSPRWPDPNKDDVSHVIGRKINWKFEFSSQLDWASKNPFRKLFDIPDKIPVVCVRGNHDFIPLSYWIGGNVWEASKNPSEIHEVNGFRFAGFRGINAMEGEWKDEMTASELEDRASLIPKDIDFLISHAPPLGIADNFYDNRFTGYGIGALARRMNQEFYSGSSRLKGHFFGHVHFKQLIKLGNIMYSNAATGFNEIEID